MRVIIPAFLDWKNFWEKALQKGSFCPNAIQIINRLDVKIDDPNKELSELKKYWPSNAEKWFNPYQELRNKFEKK
jgi:hypothetical protein